MSPGGQQALLAGGTTAFICDHIRVSASPKYFGIPLPDLFELDLKTTCWIQASHMA